MYLLQFATNININTYAFPDNGSNDSYLLQSTSDSLQLDESLETEEFFIDGFHDSKQFKARSVELTIHPFENLSEQFLVIVLTRLTRWT